MLCPPVKSLADNGQVFRLLTSVWKVDFFICCVLFHLKKKTQSANPAIGGGWLIFKVSSVLATSANRHFIELKSQEGIAI